VARHTSDDDTPAPSFATRRAELATIVRSICRTPHAGSEAPSFEVLTAPNVKQQRAREGIRQIRLSTETGPALTPQGLETPGQERSERWRASGWPDLPCETRREGGRGSSIRVQPIDVAGNLDGLDFEVVPRDPGVLWLVFTAESSAGGIELHWERFSADDERSLGVFRVVVDNTGNVLEPVSLFETPAVAP
jgi:hypothetical protein